MVAWNSVVYRLVNISTDKINYDGKLSSMIGKTEFDGYKKYFILKLFSRKNVFFCFYQIKT